MLPVNPYPAASVAARRHAELEAPNEAVGFILSSGEYVPLVNVARDPTTHWDVRPEDYAAYADAIACVMHSHCYASAEFRRPEDALELGPSHGDMILQQEWACNFGLVVVVDKNAYDPVFWGPGIPRAPLIGRSFVFGIYDCMTLLRDWYYQERDIDLPDFPREIEQIENNENLYVPNIEPWGFRTLSAISEVRPGDVLLAQLGHGATVTNHAGIYLETGELLHHLRGRLSRAEPVNVWRNFYTHACRFEGLR
jgi:proteasome lid subunit RPN8/RPN11